MLRNILKFLSSNFHFRIIFLLPSILSMTEVAYIDRNRCRRSEMSKPRQDAWTKDEDILLAEIVLQHIREGKTQLEAFKQAGEALSRTPAACGFRWNATIRKKYTEAINLAKKSRKQTLQAATVNEVEQQTIESAISMLERMKENVARNQLVDMTEQQNLIIKLQEENERLKMEIQRYQEAWSEMKNLWDWIETKNEGIK